MAASLSSCSHVPLNLYESATREHVAAFKQVRLPLADGTSFHLSQGAFGPQTHHDHGLEYKWDFDVPYGTPVVAVEDGTVFQVWQPNLPGGCNPKFADTPNNVKILHPDGTLSQYVHIESWVKEGQKVKRGDVIAVTANNGFLCTPQLCFSVFRSKRHLFGSSRPQTIPLRFSGVADGVLRAGTDYRVPTTAASVLDGATRPSGSR